ncbi:MAG: ribonucleotide reductase, partial [Gammaproteobacteria bacterium HGW-Gammaproteobacteria-9]
EAAMHQLRSANPQLQEADDMALASAILATSAAQTEDAR